MESPSTKTISGLVYRIIPTSAPGQDLYDDLSDSPSDRAYATSLEIKTKPGRVTPGSPVIHRPFDESEWYDLVGFPFENIASSRLSLGDYGVWYGSTDPQTTIHESLHYLVKRFLDDCLDGRKPTRVDRRIYQLDLQRIVADMSKPASVAAKISDPNDYSFAQVTASKLRSMGMPGIYYRSARCGGNNVGLFEPEGLSNPREIFHVSFVWDAGLIRVMRGSDELFTKEA